MQKLIGKVAVITGGTRGIGMAIAKAYIAEGASVVIASRSKKSVDEATEQLQRSGGKAVGMPVNVSEYSQVCSLKRLAIETFGGVDIWINNAGTAGPYGPTAEFTPQAFYQVIQTNIFGVFNGSHTAIQTFLKQDSGKLINLLGHGYKSSVPYQNAYASSKSWVRAFSKNLAKEIKNSGVGVFTLNPGLVSTELLTDLEVIRGSEDKLKVFPTVIRLLAKPPMVPSEKAVWLASSATDGKNGLEVSVSNPGTIIASLFQEAYRKIKHRPTMDVNIKMNVILPYDEELE